MRAALARLDDGRRVVIATVLSRKGSAPSTPGQKLVLLGAAEAVGTVGGGAIELKVLREMAAAMAGGRRSALGEPFSQRYELGATIGMCCGGSVEVLFEVMDPALTVLVVGAGHIGSLLTPMLDGLGFRVVVCDHRDEMFHDQRVVETAQVTVIHGDHDDPDVSDALGNGRARAAALVMTHDHQLDQQVIEWALRENFVFVGGVGSRAKAARSCARLEAKGFASSDIDRVHMPLGVDISARLPAEIAVSICGQLIRWRAELLGTDRRHRAASRKNEPEAEALVAEE
jgi:xanthine dehydrogenase accessory factor